MRKALISRRLRVTALTAILILFIVTWFTQIYVPGSIYDNEQTDRQKTTLWALNIWDDFNALSSASDTDSTQALNVSQYVDPRLYINMKRINEKKHDILMWNPPGWMQPWFVPVNFNECSYSNCRVVQGKENLHTSSAVVFSVGDLGMGSSPPITKDMRNPDQAWIFFTLESPVHLTLPDFRNPSWRNALNWSWTYRTDADIFHPYGILQTRQTPLQKNYSEIFRRKTKMAAWAVSHCFTHSRREEYIKVLKGFANVDVYGQCGLRYPDNFKSLLDNDYKFYMGFENSFCPDYITEKLFEYYKSDLITIVRGATDYEKYLPKGSYINAADFSSVKELGEFMHKLGNNEEEYIKYLKIKDQYSVEERQFVFRDALCSICHKLNNLEQSRKTYGDIVDWLGTCYQRQDVP